MKRRFSQLMYLLITCTLVFGQPAIASSPRLPTVLRPSSAVRSAGTFESPLPQPPPTPPAEPPAESQDCAAEASDDAVLRVSFAAAEARPGQEAALSWTVLNCRPANLEGTQLTYVIPQGFTLSPQDVPAPLSYNPDTRTVSGGLPSLAAGATLTAQFPLRVTGLRAGVPMKVTKHYSFGGQRIAMREGQGPFTYLHVDHLGSTLAATDSTGTVLGGNQPRYYAYGTERRPSIAGLPTSYTYTGQRWDAGSGLMYYGARYYDSRLGTFVQPDTVVPQPSNPQNLNRYAYGLGNPIKYRDPSGHWVETAFDIVSIGLDIAEVKLNPSLLNVGALVVDVGAAVVPFIPSGAGWLARGGKAAAKAVGHADDVADASKAVARVEDVRHATQTKWVQNVLNGIDLAAIKNPGRFGRAFYVAEEGATGVAEVAAHGGDAQKVIRFQLDLSRAKVLDLADSKIAKAWGYVHDVDGYLDHQALADRAVEQGYNAIKFNSYRGAGANYAFLDNPLNPFDFEQWLIPQMVSPVP